MKHAQFELNAALSVSLNIVRLHRWINRRLSLRVLPHRRSGDSRYRMAFRANLRRMEQARRFRFNAFRSPIRRGGRR